MEQYLFSWPVSLTDNCRWQEVNITTREREARADCTVTHQSPVNSQTNYQNQIGGNYKLQEQPQQLQLSWFLFPVVSNSFVACWGVLHFIVLLLGWCLIMHHIVCFNGKSLHFYLRVGPLSVHGRESIESGWGWWWLWAAGGQVLDVWRMQSW